MLIHAIQNDVVEMVAMIYITGVVEDMFTILQQEVDVRLLVWIILYLKAINVLSRLFCRTYIIIDEILVLCIINFFTVFLHWWLNR